jgi:hypothetical protein
MGGDEGNKVDIELSTPIKIDGADVTALRMREPTVNDQLVMDAKGGTDAQRELSLMANLCQVKPEDLKKLTLRDYKKVQKAFSGFLD